MKHLYRSLLFATVMSVSTTLLADGKSPDLLAALPQGSGQVKSPDLLAALPKGSAQVMSQDEAKDIRGEYKRCHWSIGVCNYRTYSSYYGNYFNAYNYSYWHWNTYGTCQPVLYQCSLS